MLDLETVATSANAAIISIGAVWFDVQEGVLGEAFYQAVDLSDVIKHGFDVDGSTLSWWMKQSEAARQVFDDPGMVGIEAALKQFANFVKTTNEPTRVWGKGPAFDNAILANAYRRMGLDKPWIYYDDRCVRTMQDVGKYFGIEPPQFSDSGGVPHNALDDARYQAECICYIFSRLPERPVSQR